MSENPESPPPPTTNVRLRSFGFLAGAIGGLLIAMGALLPWAQIVPAFEGDYGMPGVDLWEGLVVLLCGVSIVLGTFLIRFQSSYERRRATCIAVIVLAILSVALTASVILWSEDRILGARAASLEIAEQANISPSEALRLLHRNRSVHFMAGTWLTLGGAALALLGGILSLRWIKKRSAAAEAAGRAFGASKKSDIAMAEALARTDEDDGDDEFS